MERLETELNRARDLQVGDLADAIETIGFECTRCGGCCTGYAPDEPGGAPAGEGVAEGDGERIGGGVDEGDGERIGEAVDEGTVTPDEVETGCHGGAGADHAGADDDREPHTATVFPDEVRAVADAAEAAFGEAYDWRDVARPMPYGLATDGDGDPVGETFEWALATDDCGDCTFYEEADGQGACTVHDARPLICRTYPFSVALGGTSQPMGEPVDAAGVVRAHECEGLGRDIDRDDAEALAAALKERAVRELEEAIGVRDGYDPAIGAGTDAPVVVFDSEGAKRADGTPIGGTERPSSGSDDRDSR
ncbi:YkgJ family cysteine cluster protein [Halorubrum sp. JWXQ-INN 858]|uniref:YkgJ family cysteine cluster protein n=1 Tax=Halorubrum sp. JWXQ-INN 858 TaxID=2690782 RepID=UPI0013571651|nr:YkgJ family cysteine cluster protein [Halorubrum sp. JWXQ-INN 858]MWV63319.1 YkgJ family cysteine cluster protein [Halorubrum sp. JWXQ-INN 858]